MEGRGQGVKLGEGSKLGSSSGVKVWGSRFGSKLWSRSGSGLGSRSGVKVRVMIGHKVGGQSQGVKVRGEVVKVRGSRSGGWGQMVGRH